MRIRLPNAEVLEVPSNPRSREELMTVIFNEKQFTIRVTIKAPSHAAGEAFIDELNNTLLTVARQKARQTRHGCVVTDARSHTYVIPAP